MQGIVVVARRPCSSSMWGWGSTVADRMAVMTLTTACRGTIVHLRGMTVLHPETIVLEPGEQWYRLRGPWPQRRRRTRGRGGDMRMIVNGCRRPVAGDRCSNSSRLDQRVAEEG